MLTEEHLPEHSVDDASEAFRALERELGKRSATTTEARRVTNAVRAVVEAWFRSYRPQFVAILGDLEAIAEIDREVRELRVMAGGRMALDEVRKRLRRVNRLIDRQLLPAYDATRWTTAASPRPSDPQTSVAPRLDNLSPDLAKSYQQVHADLADDRRQTFLGSAGEIREVLRAVIHLQAPDDDVMAWPWYVGHEGKPTQAERIRHILESRSESEGSANEAVELIEEKVGRLGRNLYSRASKSLHAGAQRDELQKVVAYVEAVLNEILPASRK